MLFGQEKEWIRKVTGLFDVTMGCLDGAKICELVGAFALSELSKERPDGNIGLQRGDSLGVLWNTPGNRADWIRKEIIKVFKNLGLNITIQINLKVVDFLDVSLNLSTESFYPYRKPNDWPMYIHRQSGHPPNMILGEHYRTQHPVPEDADDKDRQPSITFEVLSQHRDILHLHIEEAREEQRRSSRWDRHSIAGMNTWEWAF